jgi:hypothetical protein
MVVLASAQSAIEVSDDLVYPQVPPLACSCLTCLLVLISSTIVCTTIVLLVLVVWDVTFR